MKRASVLIISIISVLVCVGVLLVSVLKGRDIYCKSFALNIREVYIEQGGELGLASDMYKISPKNCTQQPVINSANTVVQINNTTIKIDVTGTYTIQFSMTTANNKLLYDTLRVNVVTAKSLVGFASAKITINDSEMVSLEKVLKYIPVPTIDYSILGVVSIDLVDGVMTAVGEGVTVVTASITSISGAVLSDKCEISVAASTDIELSAVEIVISLGEIAIVGYRYITHDTDYKLLSTMTKNDVAIHDYTMLMNATTIYVALPNEVGKYRLTLYNSVSSRALCTLYIKIEI